MKNLFKSLMLVAVAAMGFTSCQKEELPTQSGAEKFTIDVIANLEETRSAFGEKSGNAYPSYWQGGETVKAAILQYGKYSDMPEWVEVVESEEAIVAVSDAKTAQLTLEWDSMSQTYGTMLIAVPYGSVTFDGSNRYFDGAKPGFVVNVPTEQTPLENSVDPAAHILTATYEGSFSETIMPEFEHAAAYGKMTLENFEGVIDNVVVTIDDTKSYILNADYVTGNVFWFGCEANEAPETVKIAVNTTDKSYTKTLDLTAGGKGNGLRFFKGHVAEFGVDMTGIDAEEGNAGTPLTFPANTYMWDTIEWDSAGYYKITSSENKHGDGSYVRIYLNEADRPNNNSIKPGTYTAATGNKTPDVGNFCARVGASGSAAFWTMGESSLPATATLEVNFYDGKYQILFTKSNTEHYGYEGMTEGWVAPTESGDDGGEEPENPGEGGGDEPETPGVDVEGFEPVTLVSLSQGSFGGRSYYFIAAFEFDYMGETINVSIANANTINLTSNNPIPAATYNFVSEFNYENLYADSMSEVSVMGYTGSGGNAEVIKNGDIYTLKMTLEYTMPIVGTKTLKVYYHGAIK